MIAVLDNENIDYDKKVVAKIIEKHFPDFRRVFNQLQSYSASGKIDEGIFADVKHDNIDQLFEYLKNKDFKAMRKWCSDNSDQDMNEIFAKFYSMSDAYVAESSMPGVIVTLGEYQYKHAFVADPEINMAAFLTEVMFEAQFK